MKTPTIDYQKLTLRAYKHNYAKARQLVTWQLSGRIENIEVLLNRLASSPVKKGFKLKSSKKEKV